MKMYAYLLSEHHGTVQIGRTVWHLPTRKHFRVDKYCRKGQYPRFPVHENSFKAAWEAYRKIIEFLPYYD